LFFEAGDPAGRFKDFLIMSTYPLVPYSPFAPAIIENARAKNQNLRVVSKAGAAIQTPQIVRRSVSVDRGFKPISMIKGSGFRFKKGRFIDIYV
jgi:hypothetical protein